MKGKQKHTHRIECAGHLDRGLNPELRLMTLENIIRILKVHDFDAIAFSGLSGALFAPMVAMGLNKTLLAVRKGEPCHSGRQVEGDYNARRYVILDDFIAAGGTVRHILEEIRDAAPNAECIGILEYCYINRLSDPEFALSSPDKYEGRSERPPNPWLEVGVTPTASGALIEFAKQAPLVSPLMFSVEQMRTAVEALKDAPKPTLMYRIIDSEAVEL